MAPNASAVTYWTAEAAAAMSVDLTAKPVTTFKSAGSFKGDYLALCKIFAVTPHPAVLPKIADAYNMTDSSCLTIKHQIVDATTLSLLLKALTLTQSVTSLEFYKAGLTAQQVEQIAAALSTTTVTTLSISYNPVAGSAAFIKLLADSSPLKSLCLRGCDLDDTGAAGLAAALEANTRLTALNLFGNKIGDAGAAALYEALKLNSALTGLSLAQNALTAACSASFVQLLSGYTVPAGSAFLQKKTAADARIAAANKAATAEAAKKKKGTAEAQLLPLLPAAKPLSDGTGTAFAGSTSLAVLNLSSNATLGLDTVLGILEAVAQLDRGAVVLKSLHLQRCCAVDDALTSAAARAQQDTALQVHLQ
jgi:Leucine Rich repeat